MKPPAKINRMWEIIVFHKIGVGLTQILPQTQQRGEYEKKSVN